MQTGLVSKALMKSRYGHKAINSVGIIIIIPKGILGLCVIMNPIGHMDC